MLFKQKERIKILMKLYRKRGMDCSQKATSIPLQLKSKVQNQGEEDGVYEYYLVFLEKREESRNFGVFLCFLGEKYGEKRGKRNVYKDPQTAPKTSPLQSELLVAFYRPCMLFEARLTSAILSICTFLVLTLDIHLQVFSDSD